MHTFVQPTRVLYPPVPLVQTRRPETAVATPSLRSSFSWSLAGNVVYAASQWGMLVALAKLGSPEMTGQLSIALALTTPVVMFSNLQLRVVQATDAADRNPFATYLSLRAVTSALALAAIGALTVLGGYRREIVQVVMALALTKVVDSLSDVAYGHLQKHERVRRIAQSMILRGALALASFAVAIRLTHNLLAAIFAMCAAWLSVLLAFDLPACASIPGAKVRLNLGDAARIARLSLPLGISMCLVSLGLNVPRYFIEARMGEHALGVFTALSSIYAAGTLVIGAAGQSVIARLSRLVERNERRRFFAILGSLLAGAALLGASGLAVALLAGHACLVAVFSPAYAQDVPVFAWLMAAAGVSYCASVLGFGLNALRCFNQQALLFGAVCAATAAVAWWAVPRHGLAGGAASLVAGAIVQLVGTALLLFLRLRAPAVSEAA